LDLFFFRILFSFDKVFRASSHSAAVVRDISRVTSEMDAKVVLGVRCTAAETKLGNLFIPKCVCFYYRYYVETLYNHQAKTNSKPTPMKYSSRPTE